LLFLLCISIENRGAVLGANVISLPVEGRGIVGREKYGHQVAKRNLRWIEFDLGHFRMPGVAGANLLVGGILCLAPGIAGNHRMNTAQLIEDRFHTPEATAAEYRRYQPVVVHERPSICCARAMPSERKTPKRPALKFDSASA
jgi:hypothetical protein